jgi:hypothetical protein
LLDPSLKVGSNSHIARTSPVQFILERDDAIAETLSPAVGTVMPMGGDWALTDAGTVNGSLSIDVRQTFKTDDDAFIQVFETGRLQPDGSAFVRLGYETGYPKYSWLNTVVAIGIIRTVGTNEISIDTWQVSLTVPQSPTCLSP